MLYGVKLRNRVDKDTDIDIVVLYENYETAKRYEREIRFLDNVVDGIEYKRKVMKIKDSYKKSILLSEVTESVEYINDYPILVEHF